MNAPGHKGKPAHMPVQLQAHFQVSADMFDWQTNSVDCRTPSRPSWREGGVLWVVAKLQANEGEVDSQGHKGKAKLVPCVQAQMAGKGRDATRRFSWVAF